LHCLDGLLVGIAALHAALVMMWVDYLPRRGAPLCVTHDVHGHALQVSRLVYRNTNWNKSQTTRITE
jgi:hypothetical protein